MTRVWRVIRVQRAILDHGDRLGLLAIRELEEVMERQGNPDRQGHLEVLECKEFRGYQVHLDRPDNREVLVQLVSRVPLVEQDQLVLQGPLEQLDKLDLPDRQEVQVLKDLQEIQVMLDQMVILEVQGIQDPRDCEVTLVPQAHLGL